MAFEPEARQQEDDIVEMIERLMASGAYSIHDIPPL